MTPYPEHIHHFSWATRISLDLPIGFEEAQEDPEQRVAMYADDLDPDDETGGKVMTRLTPVPQGQDQAYLQLAQATAPIVQGELLDQKELVIDGTKAIQQIFTYYQQDAEIQVIRHETFAQVEHLVFSIIAIAPAERKEEYLEIFNQAARSVRFILV
jgi:hypothetical protein